jgi:transglutaminase-like putative cysteine protease
MRITTLPFTPRLSWLDVFTGRLVNPAYPGDGGPAGGSPPPWNPRGYFGFSATVDLRVRGRLDDEVVMRVRATHRYNWRALVFDTYTGVGWTVSDPRVYAIDGSYPPITLVHQGDEALGESAQPRQVVQTFFIDREQPNVVFAAPIPERLYVPSSRVYLDRFGAVRLTNTLKPGTIYSVVSRAFVPDSQRLRASPEDIPRTVRDRYLALPALPARVRALAQRLAAGQPTRYDRVMAVHRFLRTHYRYDLTIPPQARPGDAVDHFLFVERRGYCEHFASAMVVLLRAAGIPARLVTGYTSGTPNLVTGLFEVRNSDAHAWVEVYFMGQGWVEFDPTPGFAEATSRGAAQQRWAWQDLWDLLSPGLARWVEGSPAAGRALGAAARAAGLWSVALLVAALGTAGTRRVMAQRHAAPQAAAPQRTLAGVYHEMCGLLARRGIGRAPAETVEEYRRRVERAAGAAHPLPEVGLISRLVEAAAYGAAVPDQETLQTARAALQTLAARVNRRRGAFH